MMKMSREEKDRIACRESLEREVELWHNIYVNGCQDPFWPDGANMNLVRNHIIFYVKKLKEEFGEDHSSKIPRKVSDGLMIPGNPYFESRMKRLRKWNNLLVSKSQMSLYGKWLLERLKQEVG